MSEIQTQSIHSYESCPRCKTAQSFLLETHVTGEQSGLCMECGYQFVRRLLHSDQGKPIMDVNGKFIYKEEKVEAYCFIDIQGQDDEDNFAYSIASEEELNKEVLPYIEMGKDFIRAVRMSRWDGEKIVKTFLVSDNSNKEDHDKGKE